MKLIDRLRQQTAETMASYRAAVSKGDYTQSRKLQRKLAELQERITEAEAYEPHMLRDMIDEDTMRKHNLHNLIIKTHIAADYLTECAMNLRTELGKLGFIECNLFEMLQQIEELAAKYAAIVCHPEFGGLSDFMTTNSALIDALQLITDRYIKEHLKLKPSNDEGKS